MRWLAALAVILLAFGVFVFIETRSSSAADVTDEAEVDRAPPATGSAASPTNARPTGTSARLAPRSLPAIAEAIRASSSDRPSAPPALDPTAIDTSAGSAERAPDADDYLPYPDGSEPSATRVKLRGAARRMNNGNFKGALEAADSVIAQFPENWEAFSIAVPSLCAMGDQDKAASYFGRVTDEPSRAQIIAGCTEYGVKLGP